MYSDKPSFSFLQWLAGLHSMSLAPQIFNQKKDRNSAALPRLGALEIQFEVVLQRRVKATDAVTAAYLGFHFQCDQTAHVDSLSPLFFYQNEGFLPREWQVLLAGSEVSAVCCNRQDRLLNFTIFHLFPNFRNFPNLFCTAYGVRIKYTFNDIMDTDSSFIGIQQVSKNI